MEVRSGYIIMSIFLVWLGLATVNSWDLANPFNKSQWQPRIPDPSELLNETYQSGLEEVLRSWWRQRRHISRVLHHRMQISLQLDRVEIQPFDDQLNSTMELIDREILVIQDAIWGEKKVKPDPKDTSKIDLLSKKLKGLQDCMRTERLPAVLKEIEDVIREDIQFIRAALKLGLEELSNLIAQVEKAMAEVETGTVGRVTPHKFNQVKY